MVAPVSAGFGVHEGVAGLPKALACLLLAETKADCFLIDCERDPVHWWIMSERSHSPLFDANVLLLLRRKTLTAVRVFDLGRALLCGSAAISLLIFSLHFQQDAWISRFPRPNATLRSPDPAFPDWIVCGSPRWQGRTMGRSPRKGLRLCHCVCRGRSWEYAKRFGVSPRFVNKLMKLKRGRMAATKSFVRC